MIDISVIVPVRNAAATLGNCLEALLSQDLPAASYEIILVDNQSTDDSVAVAERYQGVRVLSESQKGAYKARNRGLQAASGKLIAFTDADCVPQKDWLRCLKKCLADPRVKIVMGRDIPAGQTTAVRLLGNYDHFKEIFVMSSSDPGIYYGHTNCLMTRREIFDETDFFDERPRGADVIFVQRVLSRYGTGAVLYQSDAVVAHTEIRSAFVYFKKAFIYGRSARSYRRIVAARPLRNKERMNIFREVVNSCKLSGLEAIYLLALLMLGVGCYGFGWLSLMRVPRP